ncbi:MAG: bifunctional oligoribonuclease/PAP phosphatase NrnA [Salibacteraceae bacterium]
MRDKLNASNRFGKKLTVKYDLLKELFESKKSIVISTHRSPDGDAIGSSIGLYHVLIQLGHEVTVLVPDAFPHFLEWMDGTDEIIVFENQEDSAKQLIKTADVLFCLDYNRLDRVGEMGEFLKQASAFSILIDHHIDPDTSFEFILSDTKASSTAELVYRFLSEMNWLGYLNLSIAEALYAGIMTDTGSFKYNSTTAETHRIAAKLIDQGMFPDKVHSAIFDTNSIQRLQLIGYALSKKMTVDEGKGISIIGLSLGEKNRFKYKKGGTEGLVNYGLSVKGIKMAIFLSEELSITKLSIRSKGDLDVNKIAREHFNGGGHKNAAGGKLDMKLKEALNYLNDVIQNKLDL